MRRALLALGTSLSLVLGCGGADSSKALPVAGGDDGGAQPAPQGDDAGGDDASAPEAQDAAADTAAPPPGIDASFPPDPTDGTPTRQACTSTFGSALTAVHGRLDGVLVSLVPHGTHSCNGDNSHLHLQIQVNGAIYDVATNLDTLYFERDGAMPGPAFQEGWHPDESLDYPAVGVHSGTFVQPPSQAALYSILESALANANHLSVFATGYGPDGIHDVHRRGSGNDGAIVIDPLSSNAHVFFFRFDTDSF